MDIRRCDDSGVKRLVNAILMNTIRDWNVNVKIINNKGNKNIAMYELKQIIDFIQSDYFVALTDGNCPQDDTINKLTIKINNEKAKQELNEYIKKNKNKWRK